MSPPLVKGGQGRRASSVRDDATALALTALALALVAVLLFFVPRVHS